MCGPLNGDHQEEDGEVLATRAKVVELVDEGVVCILFLFLELFLIPLQRKTLEYIQGELEGLNSRCTDTARREVHGFDVPLRASIEALESRISALEDDLKARKKRMVSFLSRWQNNTLRWKVHIGFN